MKKYFLLFVVFIPLIGFESLSGPAFAQTSKIDSLFNIVKTGKEDTVKLNALNDLSRKLEQTGNYERALQYAHEALELSDKLLAENKTALPASFFLNKKAKAYNSIGIVYYDLGNYNKALENYFTSLKIKEKIGDKQGIASSYNNIGNIYFAQDNYNLALKNHFASLKMKEEIGDRQGIAASTNNIGAIYSQLARQEKNSERREQFYNKSQENYIASLKIKEESGDKIGIAASYNNIGVIYFEQARLEQNPAKREALFTKALENYFTSLKMREEIGDKQGIASVYNNFGNLYLAQSRWGGAGKIAEARKYNLLALNLDLEIGSKDGMKEDYFSLSACDSAEGNFKGAYQYFKLYSRTKDSLLTEESSKQIAEMQTKYDTEKKEQQIALLNKEGELQKSEVRRQKIIIGSGILGLLLVIVFSIFIYNRLQVTRKQKAVITQKNKQITDSINYAKRIQDAILPSGEEFSKYFPEHFIFFRPRDIVSGDFYWLSDQNEKVVLAVADCTGHGVPGAFMSMIGNTLLNEIINEQKLFQPAEILDHLHEGIVHALHQESRTQDDGMDISVCLFDKETNKITFAGANHSMYVVRNNIMQEIKGDIYSIGSLFGKNNNSFTQKEIALEPGSNLFFLTDGFPDQVGGANGKKFMTGRLEKLLLSISPLGIKEQEQTILKAFEDWKGSRAQLDDVLLIGIKV